MQVYRTPIAANLEIALHAHDLPVMSENLPAWTLFTVGLASLGQRELALTVLRKGEALESFPQGVLGYLPALQQFASQGRIVDAGGISGYRSPGPFGFASFVGLTFLDAPAIPQVPLPDRYLAGVFLKEGELAMATNCSVRRVLHGLGRAIRYFPNPWWTDPARESIYRVEDSAESVLAQFDRAHVPEAYATLEGNHMELAVPASCAKELSARMENRRPTALLTGLERGVSGALVWSPGQDAPEAIFDHRTKPTKLAANFVAFVPEGGSDDDLLFMEDGYVAILSAVALQRLISSLRSQVPFEIRSPQSGHTLRVTSMQ